MAGEEVVYKEDLVEAHGGDYKIFARMDANGDGQVRMCMYVCGEAPCCYIFMH